MQLMEYLPQYFRNIREFQWIMSAEQPEMDLIYQGIEDYINDQFFNTLTLEGCKRWEQALGIRPSSSQTLEQRRLVITNRANDLPPYTFKAVKGVMEALFGKDGFILFEDTENYTLELRNLTNDRNKWLAAIEMLEKMVPAIIIIDPGHWYKVPFCGTIRCGTYPRAAVAYGELSARLGMSASKEVCISSPDKCGTIPRAAVAYGELSARIGISCKTTETVSNPPVSGMQGAGTYPRDAVAAMEHSAEIRAVNVAYLYTSDPEKTGNIKSGTKPKTHTAEIIEESRLALKCEIEIAVASLPPCGTLRCGKKMNT